jgi:signal transduction histidine kinase
MDMSESYKLLVVDDEEVIRDLCSEILSRQGYVVDTAENGMTALKQVAKSNYDLVLVDYNMPVMDGLELLANIKRDYPFIEVIIMTAFGTIQNAIDAMKKGAYDFVLKPFNADQIDVVVRNCLEKIYLDKENEELRRFNKKLQEIQDIKDKFIAITSHELRTPLSHVKGYLGILNDDSVNSITPHERREFWGIVHSAVEQLEHIVSNMYGIAMIDNGNLQIDKADFDINQLLEQMVHEYQLTLKNRKQQLYVSLSDQSVHYFGDRLKIKQMCSALIDNAIKFTPDNGEISLITRTDQNYFNITIKDSGIGIPEEELGKIFEKFYEVQNTDHHTTHRTNFMGGGLGLGLSIARAIAEAHGGGIKVSSKVNAGSIFQIFLPRENYIL